MHSILLWVLLITTIAGVGGTGLGGIISACIKRDSKKTVSLLLSFAAGVMLSIVCFDLIRQCLFPEVTTTLHTPLGLCLFGLLLGYGMVALLNYLIDHNTNKEIVHIDPAHPKTADDLDELIHSNHYVKHKNENNKLFVAGVIMAAAIALHNLPEGMVIGASYTYTDRSGLFTGSGLIMAIIIGVHNIPEGMAVAVPLIAGGMKRSKAIYTTAMTGLPTVLGAFIGYMLGSLGPTWHILSLSFASGAMLYVVFGELLPESILMWRSKLPSLSVFIGIIIGILIIFI